MMETGFTVRVAWRRALAREIEAIDKSVVHRYHKTGAPRWAYPYEQPTWSVQEIPLVSDA